MTCPDWLTGFLNLLGAYSEAAPEYSATELAPAHLLRIGNDSWARAADTAARLGYRHAGIWSEQTEDGFLTFGCFEHDGHYLILETESQGSPPTLPSQTPFFPVAARQERHLQDMLGVRFSQLDDSRRWTRHLAWRSGEYPLKREFPVQGTPARITPPDGEYEFQRINGAGVYEIPVGPVHAGIIEPGHFRFNAVGEDILSLEAHLGYVHKGIEKIAVGKSVEELIQLAGRISGDSTVSFAWATCQAVERAWQQPASRYTEQIRGLLAERERIANHLGDIGAICNDVGFAFAQVHCTRLKEDWLRRNQELFGHRLLMDCVRPGFAPQRLDRQARKYLQQDHAQLRRETGKLFDLLLDQPSLEDRLLNTGYLSPDSVIRLGCTGYTSKASGQAFDVRSANPYLPYSEIPVEPVVLQAGDVAARMQVRMLEIAQSLGWMDALLDNLAPRNSTCAA